MSLPDNADDFLIKGTEPVSVVDLPKDGDACAICYETFYKSEAGHPEIATRIKSCGHIFGNACLTTHIRTNLPHSNKCPMCRTKLFWTGPNVLSYDDDESEGDDSNDDSQADDDEFENYDSETEGEVFDDGDDEGYEYDDNDEEEDDEPETAQEGDGDGDVDMVDADEEIDSQTELLEALDMIQQSMSIHQSTIRSIRRDVRDMETRVLGGQNTSDFSIFRGELTAFRDLDVAMRRFRGTISTFHRRVMRNEQDDGDG